MFLILDDMVDDRARRILWLAPAEAWEVVDHQHRGRRSRGRIEGDSRNRHEVWTGWCCLQMKQRGHGRSWPAWYPLGAQYQIHGCACGTEKGGREGYGWTQRVKCSQTLVIQGQGCPNPRANTPSPSRCPRCPSRCCVSRSISA